MGWRDLGSLVGPKGDKGEQGPRGSSVLAVGATAPQSPLDGDAWFHQDASTGELRSVDVWKDEGIYPDTGLYPDAGVYPQGSGWNEITTD